MPEFLGNRAPFADPHARAVIAGLGMDSDLASLVALYVAGLCGIGYGLRQIIEAQAAGWRADRACRHQRRRRAGLTWCASCWRTPPASRWSQSQAEEPVLLGAAMLGGMASGMFDSVQTAMAAMSQIKQVYQPAGGAIAELHEAKFGAFKKLQDVAREIRGMDRPKAAKSTSIGPTAGNPPL